MFNLYQQFTDLTLSPLLEVGEVTAAGAGVATVTLPGGGVLQARGDATVGQRVWVRDGVIEGVAPTLTYVEGEG